VDPIPDPLLHHAKPSATARVRLGTGSLAVGTSPDQFSAYVPFSYCGRLQVSGLYTRADEQPHGPILLIT
jgi:hypothetical protein